MTIRETDATLEGHTYATRLMMSLPVLGGNALQVTQVT